MRNFIGTKVSRIGEITDLPVEEFRGAGRAFVERHGRSLKMRRAARCRPVIDIAVNGGRVTRKSRGASVDGRQRTRARRAGSSSARRADSSLGARRLRANPPEPLGARAAARPPCRAHLVSVVQMALTIFPGANASWHDATVAPASSWASATTRIEVRPQIAPASDLPVRPGLFPRSPRRAVSPSRAPHLRRGNRC